MLNNINIIFIMLVISCNINAMQKTYTGTRLLARKGLTFNNTFSNFIIMKKSRVFPNLFFSYLSKNSYNGINMDKPKLLKNLTKFKKPLITTNAITDSDLSPYYSKAAYTLTLDNIINQRYPNFDSSDINKIDDDGYTILTKAIYNNDKEAVKLLLQHKDININAKNTFGDVALIIAVLGGHQDIVQLLIDKGANINEKGTRGYAALTWAVAKGRKGIAELLINNGANINIRTDYRSTPLMVAAAYGYTDIVKLLMRNGANANVINIGGNTASMLAVQYGYYDIVELLHR